MNRVALITGGSRGIGWAAAASLRGDGFEVAVTGVTDEELGAVADPDVRTLRLDVTNPRSVEACIQRFERLDVLVNCAGITFRDDRELDPSVFADVIDVNLNGAMRMCVVAHDRLAASGNASIVNIASMLSFFGGPAVPAYSASKGGIAQLTRSLAGAWAPHGIRVNAVAPGYITSRLTRDLYDDGERRAQVEARTPMGRWGTPEDVGGVIAFLCSPRARFITGAVVPVDGGYSAV